MGFGFVVARFSLFLREMAALGHVELPHHPGFSAAIGTVLIVAGVIVVLLALWEHRRFLERLRRGEPEPDTSWSLGMTLCVFLAALGMALAGYLAFLG
jgi:putative membrane protein